MAFAPRTGWMMGPPDAQLYNATKECNILFLGRYVRLPNREFSNGMMGVGYFTGDRVLWDDMSLPRHPEGVQYIVVLANIGFHLSWLEHNVPVERRPRFGSSPDRRPTAYTNEYPLLDAVFQ